MPELVTHFTVPAVRASVGGVRDQLVRQLSELLDPDQLYAVRLAASELATNALQHGVGGEDGTQDLRVEATADRAAGMLRVTITNPCRTRSVPQRAARGLWAESGRGLSIVEAVADSAGSELLPDADGTLQRAVWFELVVQFPEQPHVETSAIGDLVGRRSEAPQRAGAGRSSVRRAAGRLARLPRRVVSLRWPEPRAAPGQSAA
ncbi:ATP-binding protein [Kitasatospora phosalacinea]|uniref:ATP-binding protein n=1 Tax=Kitasatospora phosalacinea TaxID=2065 RepID=UPI00365A948B